MKLKDYYKQEIKQISAKLKIMKPKLRRQQSLNDRHLAQSDEGLDLYSELKNFNLQREKRIARLLNLAYAVIRNKPLEKVEQKSHNPVSKEELDSFVLLMNEEHQKYIQKEV